MHARSPFELKTYSWAAVYGRCGPRHRIWRLLIRSAHGAQARAPYDLAVTRGAGVHELFVHALIADEIQAIADDHRGSVAIAGIVDLPQQFRSVLGPLLE